MARTSPPRQKDGATTGRGAGEGYPNGYDGAYATHLLVGGLPRQGQPGRCVDEWHVGRLCTSTRRHVGM